MAIAWWVLFWLNAILSLGIMLTYISRRKSLDVQPGDWIKKQRYSRTLVILPVKGLDYQLEKNVLSIQNQEYENFDLLAVVDSKEDSSLRVIKSLSVNYLIASENCNACSGKVRAISSAINEFKEYEIYVVADSDIRVEKKWLKKLTLPLLDEHIGVSTTFPIFYPAGGFWTKVKMFWGIVGQSMMESRLTRFVWGGSMAFRKSLLDEKSKLEFSESISDDVSILRIVNRKGLRVAYVPEARPWIHSTDTFDEFVEWSNRQSALSIRSSARVLRFGLAYFSVSIYLTVSSIFFSIFVNPLFVVSLIPFFVNSVSSVIKVPVRISYFLLVSFVLPFVYLYNLLKGANASHIHWRGRTYDLKDRL